MLKKVLIALTVIVLLLVLGAIKITNRDNITKSNPPNVSQNKQARIQITEDGFVPSALQINTGTTVIWTNVDSAAHRVASDPFPTHSGLPTLDSKSNIADNGTYRYTFDKPGIYGYHDELNPKVNGSVVVK